MKTTQLNIILTILIIALVSGCSREDTLLSSDPLAGATAAASFDDQGCTSAQPSALKSACGYTGKDHNLLTSGLRRIGLTLCNEHFAHGTQARQAVEAMVAHQNSVPGTSIRVYIKGMEAHTDYYGTIDDDSVFKVDFVDTDDCEEDDCSFSGRCARRVDSSGRIDEFDLAFNDALDWNFGVADTWELSTGESFFRTIFLHELNHGFGFPHVLNATSDLSTMGSKTGKWVGQKRNGLKAYDYGHLRYHYSSGGSPKPDLVLSNYTTEWSSSLENWQCDLTEGLSRTWVAAGASLNVSYTQMNRGGSFSDGYSTKIYLSRNETLDSSDVLLSSATHVTTGTWSAYHTELKTRSVTIPAGTTKGSYYIIVKVDATDAIDEFADGNNVLTIHKKLSVYGLVRYVRE